MNRRSLTADESAEVTAEIATLRLRSAFSGMAISGLAASAFLGALAWIVIRIIFRIAKAVDWSPPVEQASWAAGTIGAASILYTIFQTTKLRRNFKAEIHRRQMDPDASVVDEEIASIRTVTRFREAEHFTEFLLLETEDGRVRSRLDDSTTNTEGDRPRRSTLRLGRTMRVLHFPASGCQITKLEGETIRRPKAKTVDPRDWPEGEVWLDPDQARSLLAKYSDNPDGGASKVRRTKILTNR